MEEQFNFVVTREEQMSAVIRASSYRKAWVLARKLPAECYVSIGCTPHYCVDDIIPENHSVAEYGDGHVYTAAEIEGGICSRKHSINEKQLKDALQCLADNGIDKDESETVLQALCYILLDEEIDN